MHRTQDPPPAAAADRRPGRDPLAGHTQGLPALREAVASVHHTTVQPEEVVVGAPEELIYLSMQVGFGVAGWFVG